VSNGRSATESIQRPASVDDLKAAFIDSLFAAAGRSLTTATRNDAYLALSSTVRERLFEHANAALESYRGKRVIGYLSAEYLPGPHLANNLLGLGLTDTARVAMAELGLTLDDLVDQECEPGLGNGGLGRLASCYLDSLALLEIPAIGYGIRYEFGIFDQVIRDGFQIEKTDTWLRWGNPWEIVRPEIAPHVPFGGRTEAFRDEHGSFRVRWLPDRVVKGVAHDTPIVGYHVGNCSRMRLWRAEAVDAFDFSAFNRGDYEGAVREKISSETISKVLYPNDDVVQGKILRLEQQFFFASCSLQDMLRMHRAEGGSVREFHRKWAIALNDTHPAIGVAELMRLLVDVHEVGWDEAWHVTTNAFGYTNHTLLPEALEKWPIWILGRLLPRHLEIILEINRRFLDDVRARFPGDAGRVTRMSLIDESGERYVRMAFLATVGSHTVNGVAKLHSELLRTTVLADFSTMWPDKFVNVTNGVTPRCFLALANPPLADLITSRIGATWVNDLDELRHLESLADDADFVARWRAVKLVAKTRLARIILGRVGITADPASLFDVQSKRFHEYKRQHLNALYIVALYLRLKRAGGEHDVPRTFVFGGKAAPGYALAKLIIKLIHAIAAVVNDDPQTRARLKVVFLADFNVKNAQQIYPAADLSEQISLAGKEASGTGNMKFAMNGALTIGTLDGANIEIRDAVGADNFFLFGLNAQDVIRVQPTYRPRDILEADPIAREALEYIASGALSNGDRALFAPLVDNLRDRDPFLVLADFRSYLEAQDAVSAVWCQPNVWARRSILNVARIGAFSSDRSVREYARMIWHVEPARGWAPAHQ
jgi:starch phosphorylase